MVRDPFCEGGWGCSLPVAGHKTGRVAVSGPAVGMHCPHSRAV